MKIREIVHRAQMRQLGLPEIQRGSAWPERKASDLADTLYRGWPVGSMVFWQAPQSISVKDRTGQAHSTVSDWVLDGQQRTTGLCTLFGITPYWRSRDDETKKVQFHPIEETFRTIDRAHPGVPVMENAPKVKGRPPVWVDVADILGATDDKVIHNIVENLGISTQQQLVALSNLKRLRDIRDREIPVETVDVDLEDVSDIFKRVNSAGTKVNAADVTLAVATAHSPGWNSEGIIPLLARLEARDFDIPAALLLKTVSAVYRGTSKFGRIEASDWSGAMTPGTSLNSVWLSVRDAWTALPQYLSEMGIGSRNQLFALSPLVGLVHLRAKFPDAYNDSKAFAWLLGASVSGRYVSSSDDRINEDVQVIGGAATLDDAIAGLEALLARHTFTREDFLIARTDEAGRARLLLMWLSAYNLSAKDWSTGERLTWTSERHPEVHHIFPKDLLAGVGKSSLADSLANLSFLSAVTNREFGNDEPETYLTARGIDRDLLAPQQIPVHDDLLLLSSVERFLETRATELAKAANAVLSKLGSGVPGR